MKSKRQTFIVAFLINIFFVLISTPWYFEFNFFAETPLMWVVYYVLGFLLSLFTIWVFLRALNILSDHDELHKIGGGHHHE